MYVDVSQLSLAAWLFLHGAAIAHAGRPLTIDDVAPVATGQLEIEVGFQHGVPKGGGRNQQSPAIATTIGVIERLELGITIQRTNQDAPQTAPTRGFEDLHINSKYKFSDEAAGFPALAAAMDIKLPTANRSKGLSTGKADETFLLIATKSFAPSRSMPTLVTRTSAMSRART